MNVPFRQTQSTSRGRTDTFQEGTPYGGPPAEEGRMWSLLVRALGYVLLLALAVAVSVGFGVGIAVGMELVGWTDTWLY